MDTAPLSVGTLLKNRYRVTRLVGGGGMAWIYEIEDQAPGGERCVRALKELRANGDGAQNEAALRDEAEALFRQEADILVRLAHPNLPRVHAFFQEQGRSYLVMEFVYGESLAKKLEMARAPLLESQVLDWAIQIAGVLAYLHSRPQPIIFRDIKPSNVMVTLDGRVRLVDFGIARLYKAGKQRDTVSMGSENYAAPEQWGKAQSDPRADIYGLGATLYHLLTNVAPLPAFVPGERIPARQYNPALSASTVAVIERAMAPDREARYASADEMQQALIACLSRTERRRVLQRLAEQGDERCATPPPSTVVANPTLPEADESGSIEIKPERRAMPAHLEQVCPGCGALRDGQARFCRHCGHNFVPPLPPVLAILEPAGAHWEMPLNHPDVLIGRRNGCLPVDLDLGFYDPEGYSSRNHARIQALNRRYQIIDLQSANGTYVNDERLAPHQPHWLRQGDRIRVGKVLLEFRIR
jgi:eukaryotic-like serine/threonine-protein kinase